MKTLERWFNVGKIVNTHGVKGEVRVISITDFADERYEPGNKIYLFKQKNNPTELMIKSHRIHKNFDLLSFEGYDSLTAVEPLKGATLKIHKDQLSELEDGEFYFHEIIGCSVFTTKGVEVGKVTEILTPGANDVWVIKSTHGKNVLIPYIEQVVKRIDLTDKIILIEPIEGLLP